MLVLAQQNTTNSPYVMPGANFNSQLTQGGAVFLPDNSQLLAAYVTLCLTGQSAR